MRENKQLWRKRRGWMDEGEKRLTDWRSFLGPERDFREMENLRRVRWLVLGCGWLMGCLGVAQDVPTSPTTHSHTNGGRWDGDPERDPRPLWGDISGSSPHHSITHLRRTPHGETRGTPKGDTHGLPMRTPLRPPSDHPQAQKGGIPTLLPTGERQEKGGGKGGLRSSLFAIFLWG